MKIYNLYIKTKNVKNWNVMEEVIYIEHMGLLGNFL